MTTCFGKGGGEEGRPNTCETPALTGEIVPTRIDFPPGSITPLNDTAERWIPELFLTTIVLGSA